MRKVSHILLVLFFFLISVAGITQDCPEKIKWKKIKTEIEVSEITLKCLPVHSSRNELESFLKKHGLEYSDINGQLVYASVKGKSRSMWIEKKWLFEFLFDANDQLIELKVKEGLTGP